MISTNYTDHTQVTVHGKQFLMVGTAKEWAAYVKAGYTVNSALRPVKGNPPAYFLTMLAPEIVRYVSVLRDEEIDMDTTEQDYVDYVRFHGEYFQSRRVVA